MSSPRKVDVVVIGAGIAGLAAARHLSVAGRDVVVVEANDEVGGRMRTDVIDGITMDHGFQLFNPSYEEGKELLDHNALDIRSFTPGILISQDGKLFPLSDPRRDPAKAVDSLLAPFGSLRKKIAFAVYAAKRGFSSESTSDIDTSTIAFLKRKFGTALTDQVLQPFLAGVFLEDDLATSKRFFDIALKSFVAGTPGVPARGMQEIPRQLMAQISQVTIATSTRVSSISPGKVETNRGTIQCSSIVLAVDARAANKLVSNIPVPPMNDVTTWYHIADVSGSELTEGRSTLVVDGKRFTNSIADPARPLVNTVVLTNAAPEYATNNRVLVSSSSLGLRNSAADELLVRSHLEKIYGVSTSGWTLANSYPIKDALPAMFPPFNPLGGVRHSDGLYLAGDYREVSSIQGALHSGRRAAEALLIDQL